MEKEIKEQGELLVNIIADYFNSNGKKCELVYALNGGFETIRVKYYTNAIDMEDLRIQFMFNDHGNNLKSNQLQSSLDSITKRLFGGINCCTCNDREIYICTDDTNFSLIYDKENCVWWVELNLKYGRI